MADSAEVIQARLLANIDDTYDKSEGSFFYDVEKTVAIELEKSYAEQELILDKGFADTSTGTDLDKVVAKQGLTRKSAVKSTTTVTITGASGASITIGNKVASDNVNFVATENKTIATEQTTMTVAVECEIAGSIGNVPIGAIKYFPVTLAGLTAVTNSVATTNGYDTETDADLRKRYYEKVRTPATSGNKYHYINWAKDVTGVGDARCLPLWNGNGTVKVIIINSNKRAADQTLITSVGDYIEDNRPIGPVITVVSASEVAINVSATLTLAEGYLLADVQTAILTALTAYLKETAFVDSYVSYAKIGSIILNTPGILDYTGLTVNTGTANIVLANTEVAVPGTVSVSG